MNPPIETFPLTLLMILVSGIIIGAVSTYRGRRKTRRWVLEQREGFDKALGEAKALAADPDNRPGVSLAEIEGMFAELSKEIDADRKRAWRYRNCTVSLLDLLQSVTREVRAYIRRVRSAREYSPRMFAELDQTIKTRGEQTLDFQQILNLRLARAYYENAATIANHAPIDWLLLQKTIGIGKSYCGDSPFAPTGVF